MKHYFFYTLMLAALSFSACTKTDDFRISSSVFISDPDNPGLPVYSEWGYNTFGAYLDRTPITSDDVLMPVKIIVKDNDCQIAFTGRNESRYQEFTLAFHLADYSPKTFYDLLDLNGKKFNLADEKKIMVVFHESKSDTLYVTEGELNVKRAQKLIIDKEEKKVVLSGTFSFKSILDDKPVSINSGRFDVGVDDRNFFLIP